MTRLMPRERVPALDLPLVGGGRFVLADQAPAAFTLLMFYRGYHCPLCKGQLRDLQERLGKFGQAGVEAIAISMDVADRAQGAKAEWDLPQLAIAYDLNEQAARDYGLYLSKAISEKEPELFSEPGLFLVKPDGTLYFASVQTMPFTRPPLDDLLMGITYANSHGYPARGEVE